MKEKIKLCLKIFIYTFQLSVTTFGGGYVIVSLMQRLFVEKLGWLSEDEMLDFAAISQTAPGSIAVNASVLVGKRLAGTLGIAASLFGTVLPPLIILSAVSYGYSVVIGNTVIAYILRGMQAAVVALIMNSVVGMIFPYFEKRDFLAIALTVIACLLSYFLNISVVIIICGSGVFGIIVALFKSRKQGENK